jgi:hypothetical protein
MPRKPKPPGWLVLVVMAFTLIFAANIPTFVRIVSPYIGAYINHVQADMQRAARGKKSGAKTDRSDSGESEQAQENNTDWVLFRVCLPSWRAFSCAVECPRAELFSDRGRAANYGRCILFGVLARIWQPSAFFPPHSANRHNAGCRGVGTDRRSDSITLGKIFSHTVVAIN